MKKTKGVMQRFLAAIMVFFLIMTMFPISSITVSAETQDSSDAIVNEEADQSDMIVNEETDQSDEDQQEAIDIEEESTDASGKFAFLNRESLDVSLVITQGEESVCPATADFTDEYDTTYSFEDTNTVQLGAGNYSFDISDGGMNHVRGSFTVNDDGSAQTLTATLPKSQWLVDIDLGVENNWKTAVAKEVISDNEICFDVPDYVRLNLYPYLVPADGVDTNSIGVYRKDDETTSAKKRSWKSKATVLPKSIEEGLTDFSIDLEVRQKSESDVNGYEQYQTFRMDIRRTPSLSGLTVSSDETQLPLSFKKDTTTYTLTTVSDSLDITATALFQESKVTINGQEVSSGEAKKIALSDCATDGDYYQIPIVLEAPNGQTLTYTIKVEHKDAVAVSLKHDSDVTMQVYNSAGALIAPSSSEAEEDQYALIPTETYSWVATRNSYYHTSSSFTAEENLQLSVATPITEDWLTSMGAKSTTAKTAIEYEMSPQFDASQHEYDFSVGSTMSGFYLASATLDTKNYTVTAEYTNTNGVDVTNTLLNTGSYKNIPLFITQQGNSTEAEIKVTKSSNTGISYYQDYKINVHRVMQLYSLSVTDSNALSYPLIQDNESGGDFKSAVLDYTCSLPKVTSELLLNLKVLSLRTPVDNDVVLTISSPKEEKEITFDENQTVSTELSTSIALSGSDGDETVEIKVTHKDAGSISQTYRIRVQKMPSIATTISVNPEDANVFLVDTMTNTTIYPDEKGTYDLNGSVGYEYTVTRNGYVSKSGSFVAGEDNRKVEIQLEKAEESNYKDISAEDDWPSFRGNDTNNGVVSASTPTKAEDTYLVWANKLGDGYSSGATGCPILVGNNLYTYAGTTLYRVDKDSGDVLATGSMAASSSFSINTPTYADGMIFVGLSNGRIQAFNADTLESLWVYTDPLGGQPNCQITYKDGYIYTGFWQGESKSANFVCISVTDEDPNKTGEVKVASWRHTDKGFYWAGSYASDNFVLVTTDDGDSGYTNGHGDLLSLDPKTGKVISKLTMPGVGDLRSSVCYDSETDAYYFTSKGGDFYQIKVNADGSIVEDSLKTLHMDNGGNNDETPPMSTCTPVIYKGRAYIGVSGSGQFKAYSGHNITVIDLESWSIAYTVPTQGYPQTSGLLTTAYEGDTEYVYVYFFDNYTPGKLRVIRDKAGQTELDHSYSTIETYSEDGEEKTVETAYVLFTPSGSQAQYAICSPIADAEGNIYFKNDSAQLMKLSSTVTSLEVTQNPDKMDYLEGDTFSLDGIQVLAHLSNGLTKNVTDYVTASFDTREGKVDAADHKITAEDETVTISYDPSKGNTSHLTMYQNKDGEAGVTYYLPVTSLDITVGESKNADLPKNSITASDVTKTYSTAEQSFRLKASNTAKLPMTYCSDNKNIRVDANSGKVTVKKKYIGSATITISTEVGNGYQAASKKVKITVSPGKVKLKSVKNSKGKKLQVTWSKQSYVTGYQLQYSTSKSFKSGNKTKTVSKNSTVKKTLSGLKKGKTYYVRIRSYRTVSGKKYYASWSTVKKVKIKK